MSILETTVGWSARNAMSLRKLIQLVSLDANTGFEHDRVHMTPIPGATVGTSVGADGTVLVAGINGALVAFGEDTGP